MGTSAIRFFAEMMYNGSMIVGNDISNYQGTIDWPTYKNNTNFVIIKASEGTSYIDTWFGGYRQQARNLGIPCGFYHFCRPDLGNSPQSEAQFFVNLMNGDPLREGEVLALDFEVNFVDAVNWCKQWLDYVTDKLKTKPFIYLNQSQTKGFNWKPVVDAGYGLWLASYQADGVGETGAWPFMAMQQTSSSQQVPGIQGNVDRDVFFGDIIAFKKYGYHASIPTPPPQPPTPPAPPEPPPTPPSPPSTQPVTDYKSYLQMIKDGLDGKLGWKIAWYTSLFPDARISQIRQILKNSGV